MSSDDEELKDITSGTFANAIGVVCGWIIEVDTVAAQSFLDQHRTEVPKIELRIIVDGVSKNSTLAEFKRWVESLPETKAEEKP